MHCFKSLHGARGCTGGACAQGCGKMGAPNVASLSLCHRLVMRAFWSPLHASAEIMCSNSSSCAAEAPNLQAVHELRPCSARIAAPGAHKAIVP